MLTSSNYKMYTLMFLLLEIACILGTYSDPPNSSQRPIIILPGIGKSRLSAKVDESVGCFRLKGNKFFNIWMNYAFFLPFKVECFSKVLTLQPNYSLNKLDPPHGVEIQVPGFGETYPIEIIDPIFRVGKVVYMKSLVDRLVDVGYKRGYSVRGAPYDFRYGIDQMNDYFDQLKILVQETYSSNAKKVALLCHSMGCIRAVHFLNQQPQEWKAQYVEKLVMLGAPMGGSMEVLSPLLVGTNYGVFFYEDSKFKPLVQSWASFMEMLPKPSSFGNSVLVQTPTKNFTAHDYEELFQWIDCQLCLFNLRRVQSLDLSFPKVEIISISGIGENTTRMLKFEGNSPSSTMTKEMGEGDGTVNQESSNFCSSWKSQYGDNFSIRCLVLKNTNHNDFYRNGNHVSAIIGLTGV